MVRRHLRAVGNVRPLRSALFLVALLVGSCASTGEPGNGASQATGQILKQHVEVIASDAFGGRETGTEGFAQAADYVAKGFREAGLLPAYVDYRQDVPLYAVEPVSVAGSLILSQGGFTQDLEMNEDVSFFPPSTGLGESGEMRVSGELVFVGRGLEAPSLGFDDYDGIDVSGKIVVMLTGTPRIEDPAARLHLTRLDTKVLRAADEGAIGVLFADPTPRSVSRLTRLRRQSSSGALMVESPVDSALPSAAISHDVLTELIASTGRDAEAVLDAARAGERASFVLNATAELAVEAEATPIDAFNIVGVLPGQDPSLRGEAVVVTAHLDHLGTRFSGFFDRREDEVVDEVFNGAIDNALGVAMMMEVASKISARGGTDRTLIFAAVTAEEAGLLGSQHLADSIEGLGYRPVANVNVDMPILIYPFNDIIGFGVEYSSIKDTLDSAAASVGVIATPDPVPSMSLFVRSDHYRFVQRGVPSVFLFNGMEGAGREGFEAFMDEHYHRPSDQVGLPIRWDDAARFARLTEDLVRRIADAESAPTWNEGAVFAP